MEGQKPKSTQLKALRKRAEEFVNNNPSAVRKIPPRDVQNLIEDLRTHQVELEMQNEDLRRSQAELEAARDRYPELYDFAPVGYITLSEKGIIIEANLTFSTKLGIERSSLIGEPFNRFITRDTQDNFYFTRLKLFETKAKQTCELQLIKKDNAPFWARLECTLVEDARENTIQSLVIITDISEHKQAEEAVRESEEKYRLIFNTETDAIMLFDAKTRHFIDINDAALSLYGYSREEFLKLTHQDITAEPEKSDVSIRQTLEGELVRIPVRYHKKKDGTIFPVGISTGCFTLINRKVLFGVIKDITEQKRTEELLSESREKYRMIFENIQDVYYEVTLDGIILEISPSIEEIFKYSREELIGTSAYNLYADPEKRDEFVRELLKKGRITDYDIILKDKNGLQRNCSIFAKLSNDENGVPIKIIGSMRDVTQRKHMENTLRENESQKTAILDASIDRIIYVDSEMKIIWANKRAIVGLDILPKDIIGQFCYKLCYGRDAPCEGCPTMRARETRQIEQAVMFHPGKDGTRKERYRDIYSAPLLDEKDEISGFIQISRDITEQKESENALRQSEERFRGIVESAPFGYYRVGKDGLWQYVNPEWERMHGYSLREIVGKGFELTQPENLRAQARENIQRALAGETFKGEFQHQLKDGSIGYHSYNILPVYQNREIVAIEGFIRDLTERKKAEDLVRNLSQKLMQTQERERQMISYELHDCIAQHLSYMKISFDTFIKGHSDISPELIEKMKEFSNLTEQTIIAVRNLSYDLRPPGLNELGLVDALKLYCEEFYEKNGVKVDFQTAGIHKLNLNIDTEIHLYRLIQEGLNNIRKHADANQVAIKLIGASPNIILRIEDDGKGFDVKAWELTLDNEKRMGLRSMTERTHLLGGQMIIQSHPMKGTKISIKIPCQELNCESEKAHINH